MLQNKMQGPGLGGMRKWTGILVKIGGPEKAWRGQDTEDYSPRVVQQQRCCQKVGFSLIVRVLYRKPEVWQPSGHILP